MYYGPSWGETSGPVEKGLHRPPAGNNYCANVQTQPEGGWRVDSGPNPEETNEASHKQQPEKNARGAKEQRRQEADERLERKQIRQEEREERKRERQKARGQEESSP